MLLSNPPYARAMDMIEHAFAIGFRVIILLLKSNFGGTEERYERLHPRGHLRRIHVLAERLQDMHDANFTGEKASQPLEHSWFVLDRNYCGKSTNNYVSIKNPTTRMPWQRSAICSEPSCGKTYAPRRSTSMFCTAACRMKAHRARQRDAKNEISVTPEIAAAEARLRRIAHAAWLDNKERAMIVKQETT